MKKQFTCKRCEKTFDLIQTEEWNDKKAMEELLALYPEVKNNEIVIICGSCNEYFKKWFSLLTE